MKKLFSPRKSFILKSLALGALVGTLGGCNVEVNSTDTDKTVDTDSTNTLSIKQVYSLTDKFSNTTHHFFFANSSGTATIKELAKIEIEDRANEYREVSAAFEPLEKPVSWSTIERVEKLVIGDSNREEALSTVKQYKSDMVYLQLRSSLGVRSGRSYNLYFTFIRTDGTDVTVPMQVMLRPE